MSEQQHHHPDVRFSLANERTLLAYQRSAIGLLAAAVAVAHFLDDGPLPLAMAGMLLLTGTVALIGGYRRYCLADKAIRSDQPLPPTRTPLIMSIALGVAVLGAAVYLLQGNH